MRTFVTTLDDVLLRGLRNSSQERQGIPELRNLEVTRYGLRSVNEVLNPFTSAPSVSHPFPQLFRGQVETLLVDDTAISTVDESGGIGSWTTSSITTYDARDTGSTKSIPSGGAWHFADGGRVWYLFNGSCMLFKSAYERLTGGTDRVLVEDTITIKTGCNFRGRIVTGGFDPSNFWTSAWQTILNDWLTHTDDSYGLSLEGLDSNFILWSSVGGGDFPLWLIYPDYAMHGPITTDGVGYKEDIVASMFMEKLQLGEFGFMPMEWQGTVLMVKPLGNGVMVYGDNGITYMNHVTDDTGRTPPTFGRFHVASYGVMSRGAIGGDEKQHVFLDSEGYLWAITPDSLAEPMRLDYKEFLADFTASEVVISYDDLHKRYFISDADQCFVLNSKGEGFRLSEISQRPTSVLNISGDTYGVYSTDGDSSGYITTGVIDGGRRSIKRLTSVQVPESNVTIAVDYRYNESDAFQRTSFTQANEEGVAYMGVSATEFRVVVKAADASTLDSLDYIQVGWQLSDKRFIRGVYVD